MALVAVRLGASLLDSRALCASVEAQVTVTGRAIADGSATFPSLSLSLSHKYEYTVNKYVKCLFNRNIERTADAVWLMNCRCDSAETVDTFLSATMLVTCIYTLILILY